MVLVVLSLAFPPLLSGDRAAAAFAGDVAAKRDDARRVPPAALAAPSMADEDGAAASAADEEFLERRALIIGYTQTAICVGIGTCSTKMQNAQLCPGFFSTSDPQIGKSQVFALEGNHTYLRLASS